MTHPEKLEALCHKFGPGKVAEMVGVTYQTIWRWRTMVNGIPGSAKKSLDFVYERHFTQS